MLEFIPSEFYRNFCEKNNIKFTDRERAAMLHNNMQLPLMKKLALLEKLAAETNDTELKNRIGAWLEYQNKLLEKMKNHIKGEDFYLVHCYYGISINGIFDSLESAQKGLKKLSDGMDNHIITKEGIFGKNKSELGYECAVEINRTGEIVSVYEPSDVGGGVGLKDAFIPFANPFERGDIVSDCRTGEIGVVETSQEKWNNLLKRSVNDKSLSFSAAVLNVQHLGKKNLDYSHIQPIYLEKLPLNENGKPECFDTKNNINDNLITCISLLLREEIALSTFTSVLLKWHEEQSRNMFFTGFYGMNNKNRRKM